MFVTDNLLKIWFLFNYVTMFPDLNNSKYNEYSVITNEKC